MKWIACEEKMPAQSCVVLLCTNEKHIEIGWIIEVQRGRAQWCIERTDPQDTPIFFDQEQITHWMPMPELPGASSPQAQTQLVADEDEYVPWMIEAANAIIADHGEAALLRESRAHHQRQFTRPFGGRVSLIPSREKGE